MKSNTATLSLFLCWVFMASMIYAAPQQNGNTAGLSAGCNSALTSSVQTVITSCVNELVKLQGNRTTLPTRPEDQLKLFFSGTKTLCGAKCFDTATKAAQNVESKCSKPNSPDENVMWFFKHALFGGKLLCQKDGNDLCVNKAVERARGLNALTDVLPLVMPLIASINVDTLRAIPQSNNHQLFNMAATYMENVLTRLPKDLVCGSCQQTMAMEAYSYFKDVYHPHVVVKLKQPDPTATVDRMLQKGMEKCFAPDPAPASAPKPKSASTKGGKQN